jgi:hypothetical protein
MDLLVHSPLNAKSSNQISSSNGNRRPYRLKIDTGAGTVKRIAILRVNNRCRNLPLSCRNLPLKAWQPSVAKLEGCLHSSAIDRRLGLQKLQIAIGKLANYVQQALVKTCETRFFDVRRDLSEKGMGDPAGDTSDGVAVTADRHSLSHGVFVIGGFKESR